MDEPRTVSSIPEPEDFVTGQEAGRLAGISPRRVREAAKAGHLTTKRPPPGVGGFVTYGRRSAIELGRRLITPAKSLDHPEPMEASTDA